MVSDRDNKNDGDEREGREDRTDRGSDRGADRGSDRDPKMAEVLKKILATGIGAAFMTEEHIRGYLTDLKLPKDVMQFMLSGASKSKDELMNRVGNEVIKIISKIDFVKEASRFVEEHKFRVTAEIDVVKKSSGSSGASGGGSSAGSSFEIVKTSKDSND